MANERIIKYDITVASLQAGLPVEAVEDAAALWDAAQKGDKQALKRLLSLYAEHPKLLEVYGNLSRFIEATILSGPMFSLGEVQRQAVDLKLPAMRADLGYDQASALERLLIDRLIVCWLRVQQAEYKKEMAEWDVVKLDWASVWDRRLRMAHRNFLDAAKTLAQVRKLLKPSVTQVNIGAQQVNVAQMETPSSTEPKQIRH